MLALARSLLPSFGARRGNQPPTHTFRPRPHWRPQMAKRKAHKPLNSAAEQGERIQQGIDRRERAPARAKKQTRPMQAGARQYPDKFPKQHLKKPGMEADLELAPMYQAPGYLGSEKLKGMAAIVTGGDSGIGR